MKYRIASVDAPWKYNERSADTVSGSGASRYPLMKISDIVETYQELTTCLTADAAIFSWAVHPKMPEFWQVHEALERLGFRYVTCAFTWVKTNKDGTTFKGVGNYTGANTEPVYLHVRGQMPVNENLVDSTILAPRSEHSKKPEELQNRIERMYHPEWNNYLELFARRVRPGWECLGEELSGNDIREDVARL